MSLFVKVFLINLIIFVAYVSGRGLVKCGLNEEYSTCANFCPPTCRMPERACTLISQACRMGCRCMDGYVLNDQGNCIDPTKCSS